MTPERWQHLNELFTAVIELEPEQRAAFLDQSCSGDPMLRSEIESLLASDGREWNLMERPALEVAAPFLADDQHQLAPGQNIDRYEIVRLIGKGGMGEVYLAADKLLNRKIALKLLPFDYTRHQDRLRRFQQEAQAASALNHPNILTIHEIGEFGDQRFIATEFVDGETLRQRMKRTSLTLPETLEIAIQVASALASAHLAGIVHRDIKPENVMLRPDGYVKLLDFGLAKLVEHYEPTRASGAIEDADLSSDLLMGTVKYMSPEQARGRNVDARSDIFSLGVMLYEMVAGCTPFQGKTTSELISAILNETPVTPANAPDELQCVIEKALRKDREQRYPAIQDLMADLRSLRNALQLETQLERSGKGAYDGHPEAADGSSLPTADLGRKPTVSSAVTKLRRHKLWTGATVSVLLATLGAGYFTYKGIVSKRRGPSESIELTWMTTSGDAHGAAVSPDGRYVAYFSGSTLWTREVATNSQSEIIHRGNSEYLGLTFSPNGSDLYYVEDVGTDPDSPALYRVSASGGVPSKLISNIVTTSGANNPITFSPDGAHLAFIREYDSGESALFVANVDGSDERKLATRYLPSSYLGSLAWSPDGNRIVCTGGHLEEKIRHVELVDIGARDGVEQRISTQDFYYIGDIAWVADCRSLLLIANERESQPTQVWEMAYPAGIVRRISVDLNFYAGLSLSVDSSALVTVRGQRTMNIWTQSLEDGEAKQITSGPALTDGFAGIGWTPDDRIVYSSNASGRSDIWIMNADGSNRKQLTHDLGTDRSGLSVSPDGRFVAFVSIQQDTNHIWRVNIDGTNPMQLTNGAGELNPVFSADGQWVTYKSSNSGRPVRWTVPVDGGESVLARDLSASDVSHSQALAVSPDGSLVAYSIPPDDHDKRNRIGVDSVHGGDPIRIFNLSLGASALQHVRWSPDGGALSYFDVRGGGAANIWRQPLDGGPGQQLTDFKADSFNSIVNFDWSRDGKRLAIARRSLSRDVVLMTHFR